MSLSVADTSTGTAAPSPLPAPSRGRAVNRALQAVPATWVAALNGWTAAPRPPPRIGLIRIVLLGRSWHTSRAAETPPPPSRPPSPRAAPGDQWKTDAAGATWISLLRYTSSVACRTWSAKSPFPLAPPRLPREHSRDAVWCSREKGTSRRSQEPSLDEGGKRRGREIVSKKQPTKPSTRRRRHEPRWAGGPTVWPPTSSPTGPAGSVRFHAGGVVCQRVRGAREGGNGKGAGWAASPRHRPPVSQTGVVVAHVIHRRYAGRQRCAQECVVGRTAAAEWPRR